MSQHTPEPWYLYELSHVIHTRDTNGKAHGLARVYGGDKLANARRIVACVNSCAGASTDVLERGAVHDWSLLMTGLEAQRNDLLYALSLIAELAEGHLAPNTLTNIATIARSAVEKVSGKN
jgi:hypothetical protein